MDRWEKFKTISTAFAAIATPIAVALVGYFVSTAVKEREVQGKFVELAVSVLQQEPDKKVQPLRQWAVQVLDRYSGVPLSKEASQGLIGTTRLPKAVLSPFLTGKMGYVVLETINDAMRYCANPKGAKEQKLCGEFTHNCGLNVIDIVKCQNAATNVLIHQRNTETRSK